MQLTTWRAIEQVFPRPPEAKRRDLCLVGDWKACKEADSVVLDAILCTMTHYCDDASPEIRTLHHYKGTPFLRSALD